MLFGKKHISTIEKAVNCLPFLSSPMPFGKKHPKRLKEVQTVLGSSCHRQCLSARSTFCPPTNAIPHSVVPGIVNAFRQEEQLSYNTLIPCRQIGSQVRSNL